MRVILLSLKSLRIANFTAPFIHRLFHFGASLILIGIFIPTFLSAQSGEEIFKKNCATCHTVGGGRLVGPDLMGISLKRSDAWLAEWIKSSKSMIKKGDADAIAIFEEYAKIPMPDQNLSDAEILATIDYMKAKSGGAGATASASAEPSTPLISSEDASADEILFGQNLFEGSARMKNGGPACISCHNLATDKIIPGGLLAKDLTKVFSRMGGDAGLTGILNAPPFPAMTEAYRNKQITEEEIYGIVSFLNKVEKDSEVQTVVLTSPLLKFGFFGFAVWICIVLFLWRKKKGGMVKQRIFDRQLKSI